MPKSTATSRLETCLRVGEGKGEAMQATALPPPLYCTAALTYHLLSVVGSVGSERKAA